MLKGSMKKKAVLIFLLILLLVQLNSNVKMWITTVSLVIFYLFVKRKKGIGIKTLFENEVKWLMIIFAFIYLALLYTFGLFYGYNFAAVKFSIKLLVNSIIPIIICIVMSEKIRLIFISEKKNITKILLFTCMVVCDLTLYGKTYYMVRYEDFLIVVGFILFGSIANNFLFNFICKRYRIKGIIIYKIITNIYNLVIPIVPSLNMFFLSLYQIVFPCVIYIFLDKNYSRKQKISEKNSKLAKIITIPLILILIGYVTLVSCGFKYRALVIGTGSMTGTINIGDVAIYERRDNLVINENDIIVFIKNNQKIVHRVIKKETINGEERYYTKGDNNNKIDDDYRVVEEIEGVVLTKIRYIGYPTLWLNEIFKN